MSLPPRRQPRTPRPSAPATTSVSLVFIDYTAYRLFPALDVERPSCSVPGSVPCSCVATRCMQPYSGPGVLPGNRAAEYVPYPTAGLALVVQPERPIMLKDKQTPSNDHAAHVMRIEQHESLIFFCCFHLVVPTVLEVASLPYPNAVSPCASGSCTSSTPTRACTGIAGLPVTCLGSTGYSSRNEPRARPTYRQSMPVATQHFSMLKLA
jgi:hypothetical protein